MRYTFIVHAVKANLRPIFRQNTPSVVRVEKRTSDTAFAPLLEALSDPAGAQNTAESVSEPEYNTSDLNMCSMLAASETGLGNAMQTLEIDDNQEDHAEKDEQACKDKKKKKKQALEVTTQLCRSTRTNKIDSFKAPSMAENKIQTRKVKPRQVPAAPKQVTTTSAANIPPPTTIPMLQQIGQIRCGIPAEDLTAAKLVDDQEGSSASPN